MLTLERSLELWEKNYTILKKVEYDKYVMFDYFYKDYKLFNEFTEARDMRGIIFDRHGNIASLPFHAFYNAGENGTNPSFNGSYQEKLDGSMVQVTWHDELIVASRGSMVGYVNQRATPLLAGYSEYFEQHKDWTYLFELLDPEHPIVVQHPELKVVLLCRRNKNTGVYEDVEGSPWESVERFPVTAGSWPDIRDSIPNEHEGVVISCDGELFKYKTPWYLGAHKLLVNSEPKDAILAWSEGRLDDMVFAMKQFGRDPSGILRLVDGVSSDFLAAIEKGCKIAATKETAKDAALSLPRETFLEQLIFGEIMNAYRGGHLDNIGQVFNNVRVGLTKPKIERYLCSITGSEQS